MPHPTPEHDPTMRWDVIYGAEAREHAYAVVIASTGAHCMNTDSYVQAIERAEQLGDAYVLENASGRYIYTPPATRPAPDFDPHIDYPERFADGKPI